MAMDRNVQPFCLKAFGQWEIIAFGQVYVKDLIATITIKVAMLSHVRAKPCRAPFKGNLPNQSALDQGSQAIIYRSHRNIRHRALGPHENLLRGGMVTFMQEDIVNLLPLRREPEPAIGQLFYERTVKAQIRRSRRRRQTFLSFFVGSQPHQP